MDASASTISSSSLKSFGGCRAQRHARAVIWAVPQYGRSVHDAPVGEIIVHGVMLGHTVVPECNGVRLPAPAHEKLGLLDVVEEKIEESVALLAPETDDL